MKDDRMGIISNCGICKKDLVFFRLIKTIKKILVFECSHCGTKFTMKITQLMKWK